jgi:hypothetical protein
MFVCQRVKLFTHSRFLLSFVSGFCPSSMFTHCTIFVQTFSWAFFFLIHLLLVSLIQSFPSCFLSSFVVSFSVS